MPEKCFFVSVIVSTGSIDTFAQSWRRFSSGCRQKFFPSVQHTFSKSPKVFLSNSHKKIRIQFKRSKTSLRFSIINSLIDSSYSRILSTKQNQPTDQPTDQPTNQPTMGYPIFSAISEALKAYYQDNLGTVYLTLVFVVSSLYVKWVHSKWEEAFSGQRVNRTNPLCPSNKQLPQVKRWVRLFVVLVCRSNPPSGLMLTAHSRQQMWILCVCFVLFSFKYSVSVSCNPRS